MPPSHSRHNSAKIADVLQVVHNPRTPEAARQQTLRRLDGLEGRRAPLGKRHSHEHDREREHAGEEGSSDAQYRRSNSDGVAPLTLRDGSPPDRSRPINTERRSTHLDSPSPSPPGTRRRVNFMDEWQRNACALAGQKVILHEPLNRDGIRQN